MASRLNFTFTETHYVDFRDKISFGNIDSEILYTRFKDGRLFGLLADDLIVYHFRGCKRPNNTCAKGYDIEIPTIGKIEVKTFTKHGCCFIPSYMKGSGRSFNEVKFLDNNNSLSGYCLCDITEFPDVYIVSYRSQELLARYKTGQIPYTDRNKIFNIE
jgi:hypothetical protein